MKYILGIRVSTEEVFFTSGRKWNFWKIIRNSAEFLGIFTVELDRFVLPVMAIALAFVYNQFWLVRQNLPRNLNMGSDPKLMVSKFSKNGKICGQRIKNIIKSML